MKVLLLGSLTNHLMWWKNLYETHGYETYTVMFETEIHFENIDENKFQNIQKIETVSKLKFLSILLKNPINLIKAIRLCRVDIPHYIVYKYYAKKIKEIIKEVNPDFLHAHFISATGFIALETEFSPIIVSVWGTDLYYLLEKYIETKWFQQFREKVSLIHAGGINQARVLKGKFKFPDEKILVSNWGIKFDIPSEEIINETKRKLKIPKEKFIVLCPRRFDPLLSPELLMDVAIDLVTENPDIIFIFASFGPLQEETVKQLKNSGIRDNIIIPGYLPYYEYLSLFKISNIYLQAPTTDGVSLTLMQGMFHGLTILTTNVDDIQDLIKDNITGIFIQLNKDSIKEKIFMLKNDRTISLKIGKNANKFALEQFNQQRNFISLQEEIKKVIEKS